MTREWDATSYHRLSNPQYHWGRRVLARIAPRGDETVIDAGCGTARLTAELATLFPRGRILAVDLSENMLRQARAYVAGVSASGSSAGGSAGLQPGELNTTLPRVLARAPIHF